MRDDSRGEMHRHFTKDPLGKRSGVRAMFTNMKVRMPMHRKLYLLARNSWIKIRTGHGCCGHLGEPGC